MFQAAIDLLTSIETLDRDTQFLEGPTSQRGSTSPHFVAAVNSELPACSTPGHENGVPLAEEKLRESMSSDVKVALT